MMGKTTVKKSQNKAANANIQLNAALSACIVRLPFRGRIRLAVVSYRVDGSGLEGGVRWVSGAPSFRVLCGKGWEENVAISPDQSSPASTLVRPRFFLDQRNDARRVVQPEPRGDTRRHGQHRDHPYRRRVEAQPCMPKVRQKQQLPDRQIQRGEEVPEDPRRRLAHLSRRRQPEPVERKTGSSAGSASGSACMPRPAPLRSRSKSPAASAQSPRSRTTSPASRRPASPAPPCPPCSRTESQAAGRPRTWPSPAAPASTTTTNSWPALPSFAPYRRSRGHFRHRSPARFGPGTPCLAHLIQRPLLLCHPECSGSFAAAGDLRCRRNCGCPSSKACTPGRG